MKVERIIHNNKTGEKSAPVQLTRQFLSEIKEIHTNADQAGNVKFSFFNVADEKEGLSEEIVLNLSEDEVKVLMKVIRASKKSNKHQI